MPSGEDGCTSSNFPETFASSSPVHSKAAPSSGSKPTSAPALPPTSKGSSPPTLPISPESTYRLAHLLQLRGLQKRSLEAVRSSLTVSPAAVELFSSTSVAYDDLREIVLGFVKKHWKEVKASAAWEEKMEQVKRGEMPEGGAIALFEVLQAVA
ncbi:hypothetical protein JCM11641_004601 [Rhodosporidiobolus odoratus]